MLSLKARQFATVFRRESDRTKLATAKALVRSTPRDVVTLEQATSITMDGYDAWAATAMNLFALRHGWPSWRQLAATASALSRSPMSEVAWVERALGAASTPDRERYDELASRYRHVRRFPRVVGSVQLPLHAHFASSRPDDDLSLMLADEPWVTPTEILDDPAYAGTIPESDVPEIRWDADGLLRRVDHEMLVMEEAAFGQTMD